MYVTKSGRKTGVSKEMCISILKSYLINGEKITDIYLTHPKIRDIYSNYRSFLNIVANMQSDDYLMKFVLNNWFKDELVPKIDYKPKKQFIWENDLGLSRDEYIDFTGSFELILQSKMNR